MERKFLLILRDSKDAVILSRFLKRMGLEGKITLATLDVAYISVDKMIVYLKHPEWINECLSYFENQEAEIKIIEYNGLKQPAEALIEIVKMQEYHLVLVTRRSIVRDAGMDLALSIAGVSSVPVMVVPA